MPTATSGRSERARRSALSACSPTIRPPDTTATSGRNPSYAGPLDAGNSTTAAASAPRQTGASNETCFGSDAPVSTNARNAPTRISPRRAGVAQYAASGPHTYAITGAAAMAARVTAPTTRVLLGRASIARQQQRHQRWPQPVELLLDRQRPEVLQRRDRAAALCEQILIRGVACEQHPVGHLEQRTDHLGAQSDHPVEDIRDSSDDHDGGNRRDARRQETSHATAVERPEVDRPGPVVFLQEQARDQIAGQREEERDAEIAATEAGRPGVEQHDSEHRQRPHTVERRLILETVGLPHGADNLEPAVPREAIRIHPDHAAASAPSSKYVCRP